jgi:hypothetical protein
MTEPFVLTRAQIFEGGSIATSEDEAFDDPVTSDDDEDEDDEDDEE